MRREIVCPPTSENSGWVKCGQCNYELWLNGQQYQKAVVLIKKRLPVVCDTCNPQNGVIPTKREPYNISGRLGGDVG